MCLTRERAIPLSANLVQGMAAAAFTKQKPRLAVSFLLSFLGLLRVSEVLSLTVSSLVFLRSDLLRLIFPDSKGAKRKGCPEAVQIFDPQLIHCLKCFCARRPPDEKYLIFLITDSLKLLQSWPLVLGWFHHGLPRTVFVGAVLLSFLSTAGPTTKSRTRADGPRYL